MGVGDTFANAVIGGVVAVVTAFTGFGPFVGGAVAGYLNRRDGVRVGALAGLIAVVPLVLLALLMFGGMFVFTQFESAMGPGPPMGGPMRFGSVALLAAFGLFVLYSAGLGAIGGYLGDYLADRL